MENPMTTKIKDFVLKSKVIAIAYRALWYFDNGRAFIGRFAEVITLFGVGWIVANKPTLLEGILVLLVAASALTLFGFMLKKTGLYDVDRYTQASKDPVTAELLEAARIVKQGYRRSAR
jgi:hypothetical protein